MAVAGPLLPIMTGHVLPLSGPDFEPRLPPSDVGLSLVSEKLALAAPEVTDTEYEPAVPLAVNTGAVATPDPFALNVVVFVAPWKVPLAPLAGAVNVTLAFGTGTLPASVI